VTPCECCKDDSDTLGMVDVENVACLWLCPTCMIKLHDVLMFDEILVEKRLTVRELRAVTKLLFEITTDMASLQEAGPRAIRHVADAERELYVAVKAWCATAWDNDLEAEEPTGEHEIQDRIEGGSHE
jgi:hypothetical protein